MAESNIYAIEPLPPPQPPLQNRLFQRPIQRSMSPAVAREKRSFHLSIQGPPGNMNSTPPSLATTESLDSRNLIPAGPVNDVWVVERIIVFSGKLKRTTTSLAPATPQSAQSFGCAFVTEG